MSKKLLNNTIRFILFSDTHLGFDFPVKPRIDRRRRGEDFFSNFNKILNDASDQKVDFVVHGGDLFFRSKMPKKIVSLVYQILHDFSKHNIPLFIVPGNHERSKLPRSLLIDIPNIFIFDEPKIFYLNIKNLQISFCGFPFMPANIKNNFKRIIQKSGWYNIQSEIKLLCLHQAIEGATVGTQNFVFKWGNDVIKTDDIPVDCAGVLCGHIHRKQILWKYSEKDGYRIPIIYPGSIERTSFAEKDEPKGYFDVTLNKRSNTRWQYSSINFIELPTRPMIDIYIKNDLDNLKLSKQINQVIETMNKNAIIRIRSNKPLSESGLNFLTQENLRKIFPKSMNVVLSRNIFPQ